MARVVVRFDVNGDLDYMSDGGEVELLIVDERCPRDRVYRLKNHPVSGGIIDKVLGSSRIGELGDMPGTEAAIHAAMSGDEAPKPNLQIVEKTS
jgi:hypothetical protein